MKVKVIGEYGFDQALFGMALSHNTKLEFTGKATEKQIARANKNAHMQGGHNKFLESIYVWLEVTAPRYWWQQADTYRLSTKQSESTMHTLTKQPITQDMFSHFVNSDYIEFMNMLAQKKDLETLKAVLPEGFLQRRVWCLSYKTLQNIVYQRGSHKLGEWHEFINQVLGQVGHPEFLTRE